MLSGCGLALGLDKYEITERGDGDGDGDGDVAASGGDDDASAGGSDGGEASGGREPAGDGDVDVMSGGSPSSGGAASGGRDGNHSGGRSSSGGEPSAECEDDQSGADVDTGCDDVSPMCWNGSCVECLTEADCADDGQTCSVEECNDGACERAFDDTLCPHFGDPCLASECTPDGCVETDVSTTFDLLEGKGTFEAESGWSFDEDAEFTIPLQGSAHGGSKVALMTSGAAQYGNVYIELDIPDGTISLTIEGYYRSFGVGTDHGDDFFFVGYWDEAEEEMYGLAVDTLDDVNAAEVSTWTYFSETIDYDQLRLSNDGTVEFDLVGTTDGGILANNRNFAADDIEVLARVCEP